jgi:predicted  nucleic acid-binding Zn-ribbon protein
MFAIALCTLTYNGISGYVTSDVVTAQQIAQLTNALARLDATANDMRDRLIRMEGAQATVTKDVTTLTTRVADLEDDVDRYRGRAELGISSVRLLRSIMDDRYSTETRLPIDNHPPPGGK